LPRCSQKFVAADEKLYHINREYNGVIIEGGFFRNTILCRQGSRKLSHRLSGTFGYFGPYIPVQVRVQKRAAAQPGTISGNFSVEIFVSYKNDAVNPLDFLDVSEQFISGESRYLVGRIAYAKLIASAWLKLKGVSVIFTPGNTLSQLQKEPAYAEEIDACDSL
jgi:hypothetical protein